MGSRRVSVVLAFLLGASLIGGVSVAIGKTPAAVEACANSKGVLQLLSAHGTCSHGFSKIELDQHGPKGERGPKGDRGPRGEVGSPGSGHSYTGFVQAGSIGTNSTDESAVFPTVPAGSYTGTVQVVNQANMGGTTYDVNCQLYVVQIDPPSSSLLGLSEARFFGDGFHPGEMTIPFAYSTADGAPSLQCTAGGDLDSVDFFVVETSTGGIN